MAEKRTALLIGATGLVGTELLHFLLESPLYKQIIIFTRRSTECEHPKVVEHIIDFEDIEAHQAQIRADDIFCTLGITKKKAGSIEAARKVEYTYPLAFAEIALRQGAQRYIIVSTIGADSTSKNYYFRAKGEVEEALQALEYPTLHILRPSLLIGDRAEIRILEDLGRVVFTAFSFFIPNKYKAIRARTVAKFMQLVAEKNTQGSHIYESNRILKIERKQFDFKDLREKTQYRKI